MDKRTSRAESKNIYTTNLYEADCLELRSKIDRLLTFIFPIQWLILIYVAYLNVPVDVGPYWQSVTMRVTVTAVIGFAITMFPLYRVAFKRGAYMNGYAVVVGQMLMSGVFSIATNGALEAYFHLIASLALIAFFREWRIMVLGVAVFTLDKIFRSIFVPHSIAMMPGNNDISWISHLGWLYFTATLLTASCIRRADEMFRVAERTAESSAASARYRSIIQQTDEAFALIEPGTFTVLECNDHFLDLIGYQQLGIRADSGKGSFMLVESDPLREIISENSSEITETKQAGHFRREIDYKRIDECIVPIEFSITAVNAGSEYFCSFSARDITVRKEAEEILRNAHDDLEEKVLERTRELATANEKMTIEAELRKATEARLRQAWIFLSAIIDEIPMPIFVKNDELRYVIANRALCKLHGVPYQDWMGNQYSDLAADQVDTGEFASQDRKLLDDGIETVIPEDVFVTPDGDTRYLHVIKRRLVAGENQKKYIIGIATDFTERKIMEDQLRQAQKMESIGQLSAGIAHEINTPTQYVGDNIRFLQEAFDDMSSLLDGFSGLLDDCSDKTLTEEDAVSMRDKMKKADFEFLKEEVPSAITQSLEGVTRIAKIVESMKDFSHPGSAEKTAVDLNRAIQSTITVAENKWKYVADVATHFDTALPLVPCFVGEINQVVLNMIVNAAHTIEDVISEGTQSKGQINVTTRTAGDDWIEILIEDSGKGISEDNIPRIFDPFFTTKEVGKGTGQGLAISHKVIVANHGGELLVDSKIDRGTIFTIRIPMTKSAGNPESMIV